MRRQRRLSEDFDWVATDRVNFYLMMVYFAVSIVVTLVLIIVCPRSFIKAKLELERDAENAEPKHNYLKEKACDSAPKTPLNESYERFLRAYDEALRESNVFLNSDEETKELMIEELNNIRDVLYDPQDHLQIQEDRDIVEWVNEMDNLTEEQLKLLMNSLIAGRLYFTFEQRQRAYQM